MSNKEKNIHTLAEQVRKDTENTIKTLEDAGFVLELLDLQKHLCQVIAFINLQILYHDPKKKAVLDKLMES